MYFQPILASFVARESYCASTVDLFCDFRPEARLRRGIASDYPFSVHALAYIAAGHVIHHTQILKERYTL